MRIVLFCVALAAVVSGPVRAEARHSNGFVSQLGNAYNRIATRINASVPATIPLHIITNDNGAGGFSSSECQVNITSRDGNVCEGIIASHCLEGSVMKMLMRKMLAAAKGNGNSCAVGPNEAKNGIVTANVKATPNDMIRNGQVVPPKNAKIFFNAEYALSGKGDIGVVRFDCSGVPRMPLLKVAEHKCPANTPVRYSKAMGAKGEYNGVVVANDQEGVQVQERGQPTQEGDSGGGAVNGNNELCGVLSRRIGAGADSKVFYEDASMDSPFMQAYQKAKAGNI